MGAARVLYLPGVDAPTAMKLARGWCETARTEGRELHIGLAQTQEQPLFLETLLQVAREGAEVARHQGRTGVAHSELYELWQRHCAREHPQWTLPLRGAPAPREAAREVPVVSQTDPRIETLERRLEKLMAELRAKDLELQRLRHELDQQESARPALHAVMQDLDERRRALFEIIFEENRQLQAHLRRAN